MIENVLEKLEGNEDIEEYLKAHNILYHELEMPGEVQGFYYEDSNGYKHLFINNILPQVKKLRSFLHELLHTEDDTISEYEIENKIKEMLK